MALDPRDRSVGRPALEAFDELTRLLDQPSYEGHEARILELLDSLGVLHSEEAGRFARIRKIRGRLVRRPRKAGKPTLAARGRGDWVGWVELKTETVDERAMENTARVIHELDPDILAVVEAEGRITLDRFSRDLLLRVGGRPFEHVMVVDGNDPRGIDVGLMARAGYEIVGIRSHVDDSFSNKKGQEEPLFGRDCPEYRVRAGAEELTLLVNHLKSKGYAKAGISSDELRRLQAERVAEIYRRLREEEGVENVVVLGDLNDGPESRPLASLLADTDLTDASEHPAFDDGGYPGTYGLSTDKKSKIDYLLLSPALYARMSAGGIFRKGAWPGSRPRRWEVFATLTTEIEAASDHSAVWAKLD